MKVITIDNRDLQVNIVKKDNKNTYFYFKREGYIQVNLSKYQTEEHALKFIEKNKKVFLNKLDRVSNMISKDPTIYSFFGKKLKIVYKKDIKDITMDENNIYIPEIDIDHQKIIIKKFEKKEVLRILKKIQNKYINNNIVDISNINLKTRFTTSRFGSCNAYKKNINMSTYLIHYDIKYIEYVFLHEISHLKHQNHGSKFYDVLTRLCPNHRQLRSELHSQFNRW